MLLPDMLQQPFRRVFHHIQHTLEAIRAAVVGIGHFAFGMVAGVSEEQVRVAAALPGQALQNGKISMIHRQHAVEAFEVFHADLPPAQTAHVITALLRRPLSARIRRGADMVIMGSRRIDQDVPGQSCMLDILAEYRLRSRRAANIAHAHKKNRNLIHNQTTFSNFITPPTQPALEASFAVKRFCTIHQIEASGSLFDRYGISHAPVTQRLRLNINTYILSP